MKIIDAHMHFSNVADLHKAAVDSEVNYTSAGLYDEYTLNDIIGCVCMGLSETAAGLVPDKLAETPMGADLDNPSVPMSVCLGINPYRMDALNTANLERAVKTRSGVAGFKIYAGYYHADINDKVYEPVYRLAADHGLAVAIHGGDTYFKGGLIEYSRPLHADRLAHAYPDMKIIICHMGFPWVMEACEIVYKHKTVFTDISGLAVGNASECDRLRNEPLLRDYFRQGLVFLNNYKKVLFGTDWPLAPVAPYIEMCKALIPRESWEDVFCGNARRVYGLN